MTPAQTELVKSSWEKVVPIQGQAAELFYGKLFELDPGLRPLFKGDVKEQGRKLMVMLNVAVRGLDDLGTLVPAVKALGKRHEGYGVKPEHFGTVGSALLWTLEQGLGPAFTPDTRAAWTEVYGVPRRSAARNAARTPFARVRAVVRCSMRFLL
jgi:hemoglobin-like flavoprotein